MKAHESHFAFLASTPAYYDVPFFQRRYVWDEQNWEDLLNSLLATRNGTFLGSIILKQETTCADEASRYMIIDGQQRLTTLSILFKVCYDILISNDTPKKLGGETKLTYKNNYNSTCFVPKEKEVEKDGEIITETEYDIKINHSRLDKSEYDSVMRGNLSGNGKITRAYRYFKDQLLQRKDRIIELWDKLRKPEYKLLVNISLSSEDNEQVIFDAINSSGVRLTCADTIKNALFQRMIDVTSNTDEVYQLYQEKWESVFLNESNIDFWNKEILSGRIKRDNIEVLLHCIAVVKGLFNPEEERLINLSDCYKKHINKQCEHAILRHFIEEIHDFAILYMEKMQIKKTTQFDYCNQLKRLLCVCENLQVSTFNPYILYLIKRQDINEDEKNTKYFELSRYIILHAICGATTKNYNKECIQFINGSATPNEMLVNDADISRNKSLNTLTNIKNDLAKLLIFWCELYRRHSSRVGIKELKYNYELEHIMPQSWEENWSVTDVPVKDENNNEIQDLEEATRKRSVSIYKIGNMTLLNSSLNKQLRNSSFLDKLNGQGRKKGIKDLADCLLTRDLVSFSSWDESNISQRTNELINLISIVWDIHWDNEGRFVVNN